MDTIRDYEVEALMQVLKEMGVAGVMKFAPQLVLNHLQERGLVPISREHAIQSLREQTRMSYSEIVQLVDSTKRLAEALPSYSLELQSRLDTIRAKYDNPAVDWKYVGRRLLGVLPNESGKGWNIVDASGNHIIHLAHVGEDYSINWNSNWQIDSGVLRWATSEIRGLKKKVYNG
jgi:hypothetical protein